MGCLLKANGLYSRTTIGAVLLAAGAGSRLGGRPKALLELGGVPLIVRQLVALSGAGVDEVVVVLGHHADAIEAAIGAFPITIERNPECVDPPPRGTAVAPRGDARPPSERPGGGRDDGQASSVRIGLQALSPKLDAVIVALADQPLIAEADIVALISAFKQRGDAAMVVPRVRGDNGVALPGNPVIFDAALRDEWLAGDVNAACRQWRDKHPARVRWFDTDNAHYRIDIDTPDDLARFTAATGHTLAWPAAPAAA
jgi:molybdenum cofactor cytidylyltransferase